MTLLRTYDPANPQDVDYFHGIVEEFIQVSGFQVKVWMLSNRTIGDPAGGQPSDPYQTARPNEDPNAADPILGEMRKRNYDPVRTLWALPDAVERNNFLEKFGMISQDVMTLHFAIHAMERDLPRRLMPGDLIQLPTMVEDRFYEVTDAMRSDYELYSSYLWKCECSPAMTSQDVAPIPQADISYGSEILSNQQIQDKSNTVDPVSGTDMFLDRIE